jgi:epoxyqueuosine reductase
MENRIDPIVQKALELGFIALGISRPGRPLYFDHFKAWLADHKNADMAWLERNIHLREDPSRLFKGCRTILSLAYPYPSRKPCTQDGFTVSRYSRPDKEDYHAGLRRRCKELGRMIADVHEGARTRICVDSAPILERSFACASGIGFIGRNNVLIIPGHGSYLYLAEILTTAALTFSPVDPMDTQCGECTRCLDACPTGALEKPFEHAGPLTAGTGKKMGDCFFGCDRCQEVCPFNGGDPSTKISMPSTGAFLGMDRETFRRDYGNTAFSRAGLEKMKRNIRAVRA